jgi:ubiquinone/menaquinone biosynthesis C-methylase UbiE
MLDVGTGDGHRAVRLASAFGAARLVLVDPSRPMVDLCRTQTASLSASGSPDDSLDVTESRSRASYHPPGRIEVWNCEAEALPVHSERFDVITCLWNVLGAVDGTARRLEALRRMAALLAPGGRLYLDVHNRYNASTAGVWRVIGRHVIDVVRPSETNGVVTFTWRVAGQHIRSHGYLFSRRELRRLVTAAGLRMTREVFVDYADGRTCGPWTGQMLACLERA